MKLKDFLKQFEGLDPEMEVLKQDYEYEEMLNEPEYPMFKFGFFERFGNSIFYEDYPVDKKITKAIVLY